MQVISSWWKTSTGNTKAIVGFVVLVVLTLFNTFSPPRDSDGSARCPFVLDAIAQCPDEDDPDISTDPGYSGGSGGGSGPSGGYSGGDEPGYDEEPGSDPGYDESDDWDPGYDPDPCAGDCTDMDGDGRTSNDIDADNDGRYETPPG